MQYSNKVQQGSSRDTEKWLPRGAWRRVTYKMGLLVLFSGGGAIIFIQNRIFLLRVWVQRLRLITHFYHTECMPLLLGQEILYCHLRSPKTILEYLNGELSWAHWEGFACKRRKSSEYTIDPLCWIKHAAGSVDILYSVGWKAKGWSTKFSLYPQSGNGLWDRTMAKGYLIWPPG